jgi:hypothetical protein
LKLPSPEQPTSLPAEKEKQVLSNRAKISSPGDKAYDFNFHCAKLPDHNATTFSGLGTEAIPKFKIYFPAQEPQMSGSRTPDWKHETNKVNSGVKPLGSDRNMPSPFSAKWPSDAGISTRKDTSPSRPILDSTDPFGGLGNILNFPTPAISAHPLADSNKEPFQPKDADNPLSRPCTASPNTTESLGSIHNLANRATSEPLLSNPGPKPFVLAERLRTAGSPPLPRSGEDRLDPITRPISPPSPSPAQVTNTFSDEQCVERPGRLTQEIRSLLLQPIVPALATVYILKAPNYFKDKVPCVKIGIAKNVEQRCNNLSATCGFTDLSECPQSDAVAIPRELAARVEKLCHMELSSFRMVMECDKGKCGARHTVSHKEWFAVSELVAVQTVKRWLRFIELMPYHNQGKYSEMSGIRDDWQKAIQDLEIKKMSFSGIQYGELSRIYDKWIEDATGKVLPR